MAILYEALIPLNPRTKKNSQRIVYNPKTGSPMVIQSKEYKQYEKEAGWFLKRLDKPIDKPVNVKCIFYRDSKRKCDLTNLLEAVDDVLTLYKVLADDCFTIVASHDGSRVLIDKDRPRTEITITDFSADEV